MLNSPLAEGLFGAVIGAVVGSLITGFFILWQTNRLLKEERRRSDEERESETKSLAAALLWEIDDFCERLELRKVYPQNFRSRRRATFTCAIHADCEPSCPKRNVEIEHRQLHCGFRENVWIKYRTLGIRRSRHLGKPCGFGCP